MISIKDLHKELEFKLKLWKKQVETNKESLGKENFTIFAKFFKAADEALDDYFAFRDKQLSSSQEKGAKHIVDCFTECNRQILELHFLILKKMKEEVKLAQILDKMKSEIKNEMKEFKERLAAQQKTRSRSNSLKEQLRRQREEERANTTRRKAQSLKGTSHKVRRSETVSGLFLPSQLSQNGQLPTMNRHSNSGHARVTLSLAHPISLAHPSHLPAYQQTLAPSSGSTAAKRDVKPENVKPTTVDPQL